MASIRQRCLLSHDWLTRCQNVSKPDGRMPPHRTFSEEDTMLSFIGMIIAGAVLGALARLVMRGEQNISVLWTIVLGAVGALVGGAVASLFGVAHTDGIDWIRWALSLVAAIVAISVYLAVTGRK